MSVTGWPSAARRFFQFGDALARVERGGQGRAADDGAPFVARAGQSFDRKPKFRSVPAQLE
jgi:hypothetical protein